MEALLIVLTQYVGEAEICAVSVIVMIPVPTLGWYLCCFPSGQFVMSLSF